MSANSKLISPSDSSKQSTQNIPLSLYVHIPWCVQKCPYCDFNSHNLKGELPEQEYIAHLLDDLAIDVALLKQHGDTRHISSIFIGGGTPSLLSVAGMQSLLTGIAARITIMPNAEITMEANPGTVEADKFVGFEQAGVNRISIGVQSFEPSHLSALGRIHDSEQAQTAIELASQLPLRTFNVDLMHGLPQQSVTQALDDLQTAISFAPPHISWYQLTIEPNTSFHSKPPTLPDDDVLWDIQEQGHKLLSDAGYQQYEISAYAKPQQQCQHNINYWRYGDYIGIGCGAHGKLTLGESMLEASESAPEPHRIVRTVKVKHPKGYMDLTKAYLQSSTEVAKEDRCFEFFMNRLRMLAPCAKADFEIFTGMPLPADEQAKLDKAVQQGLLLESNTHWQLSDLGKRYLNTLLESLV